MDVGAIKTVQKGFWGLSVKQPRDDLVAGFRIGRRRECRQGHIERAAQFPDPQIVGAEIMAPLADAMGLIYCNQRHADPSQHA